MKILVCNDDGIYSEGIIKLASEMSCLGQVTVVAPNMERSAIGHAITMHSPLRVDQVELPGLDIEAFSINGTPADCVKIGVDIIMKEAPDLIVSGINKGANLGTDVLYSGTVSAAIEGAILGFPSMAVSVASHNCSDFSFAGAASVYVARVLLNNRLPADTVLNVNIPYVEKQSCRGIKVTKLGVRKYKDNYIKREDPRGGVYYWLAGEPIDGEYNANTDIEAIKNRYISITPIHLDLTDHDQVKTISKWFNHNCVF